MQNNQEEKKEKKLTCKERIIIDPSKTWKSIFDMVVLILVGITCIIQLLLFAYPINLGEISDNVLFWLEAIFLLDIIFNFITGYYDQYEDKLVTDFKLIIMRYLKGWFIIDLISIIPFTKFWKTGSFTKLFRLARMPRLTKLFDIGRIQILLRSFQGNKIDDKQIIQKYFILNIYRLFRLVLIAVMITYFLGCLWFFVSQNLHFITPETTEEYESG